MELKDIRQLIKIVENANIGELEIVEEGKKLRISKNSIGHRENVIYASQPTYSPAAAAAPLNQVPVATEAPVSQSAPAPASDTTANYHEVKSPMVGTFYSSPSPDADPYIEVGQTVQVGQTMCIIEAMKLMNEIESEFTGKVAKILIQNAQPVEYNQTLFLIEKS